MEGTRRGRPARHSTATVVAAAVALADEKGLDAVTMRTVASRVGATAMSLYTHVADKHALVDEMLEHVYGEVRLPGEPSGDWRADLRHLAGEQRELLHRHPWVIDSVTHHRALGPNALASLEFALGALEPTGLPAADRMEVFALLTGFVLNVVRAERAEQAAGAVGDAERLDAALAGGRFPRLAAAFAALAGSPPTPLAERFDHLLERMLDGLVGPR